MGVTQNSAAAGGRYESTDLQPEPTGDKHSVSLRFRSQGISSLLRTASTYICHKCARALCPVLAELDVVCARAVRAAQREVFQEVSQDWKLFRYPLVTGNFSLHSNAPQVPHMFPQTVECRFKRSVVEVHSVPY